MRALSIYGLGGDALNAPDHTATAFWAALGGGAEGNVITVRLSKDGVPVCNADESFAETCGDPRLVKDLDWAEIRRLDPGYTFRGTQLDPDNQVTGTRGDDAPWRGNLPKKRAIRVLKLDDVIREFARRSELIIFLPESDQQLIERSVSSIEQLGVVTRVRILADRDACEQLNKLSPSISSILYAEPGAAVTEQLKVAEQLGNDGLYLDWDDACVSDGGKVEVQPELVSALQTSSVCLWLGSQTMQFAAKPAYIEAVRNVCGITAIIARGVTATAEMVTPKALLAADDFAGSNIDRGLWAAGYSHANQDTQISQQDGIHINIKEGGAYSGAAAVCLLTVHGRFDAEVDFRVGNAKQGTTFEMAAICLDPGYHHTDNSDLNSRNVNLTFDVHGAPPYASSERDEDDGFRCGWNNSFNQTKVDPDWTSASVNMYNKYGRDVGNGDANSKHGRIRLVRNGAVFVSYYQDQYNPAWVCSGVMLVPNITNDVYIRLAAKHWNKGGNPPPANQVQFNNFKLYQF